jgi:hypothetical protein
MFIGVSLFKNTSRPRIPSARGKGAAEPRARSAGSLRRAGDDAVGQSPFLLGLRTVFSGYFSLSMLSEFARGGHVVREPVGTVDAGDCAALREIQDERAAAGRLGVRHK